MITPFTWLIFIILMADFFLEALVDLLNLSAIKPKLPKAFKKIYSQKKYATSQKYLKTTTKFGLLESSFSLILTLVLILTGILGTADEFVRSLTPNEITSGLLLLLIFLLASTILQLPFSAYKTFKIESEFGFNKTTVSTFILDTIKGLLLTIVIGLPLFATIVWFFQSLGPSGWLIVWLFLTLFQLFMLFIAPVALMPLFNKFTPLKKGSLRKKIEAYAESQNFKLEGIYTMDGSKRSTKSNAFFTGFGKFKRIALFDTLIEKQSDEELVAVLAHEIGHYKKGHILKQLILSIGFMGLSLFVFSRFINNSVITSAIGFEQTSVYASLFAIGLIFTPVGTLFNILTNYLSRKNEFEADAFAAKTYKKPDKLASALKNLASENLTNLTPHPLKVFIDYSHPPVLERIKALKNN